MLCPYCSHDDSRVIDSRDAGAGVRRRRECLRCGLRFTTYERIQTTALLVVKHDGRREEFNRDKILASLRLACAKRPLATGTLEKIVADIEGTLQGLGRSEIPSSTVGEMVVEQLKQLDRVAYIRFASVYRDFADIETFREEVDSLLASREAALLQPSDSQPALFPLEAGLPRRLTPPRRGRPQKRIKAQ